MSSRAFAVEAPSVVSRSRARRFRRSDSAAAASAADEVDDGHRYHDDGQADGQCLGLGPLDLVGHPAGHLPELRLDLIAGDPAVVRAHACSLSVVVPGV